MSHEGDYTYNFGLLSPNWCDSARTGIESLVIGLTCTFSGLDSCGHEAYVTKYIDGTTGFDPCISLDYLSENIETISNAYANECNWFENLKNQVSGSIDCSVPVTGVSFTVNPTPNT